MVLLLLTMLAGADPQAKNLDFEAGTLAGWTAEGEAFAGQPVKGDTVKARRKDMKSGHQGEYWIGTYELKGDKVKGTLISDPFTVTQPWATFLIGGGSGEQTRVEVLRDGKVIFKAHGADNEAMQRVAVDLAKHLGKPIQIRIVDNATAGWGHINFDDFAFHADEPKGVRKQASPLNADEIKHAGLPPEKAAAAMTVPEGFSVSLFAGEPDVHQPIAYCFDDRGRLWVVEAYTYPVRHKHPGPILPEAEKDKGDKIIIFEDTDGDGKHDKRTVFMEGLNLVSGIEYGFGGLYIGAAPYFLHIPIKDDKPGEPTILLDGWGYQDTHETLNSFCWGPDGWLYGCHGVFTYSKVGKPGAADKDRVKINAGVWRFHPVKKTFEVFAHGTSNPWGLDYNQHGEFFVEACVIPHCFHIVQGGRYHRQAGDHDNPHTYIDIPTIADHLHYLGANPHGGNNKSDGAGGGHAHCGLMCYQGGAWPKEYHGQLFMGNIHGRRINMDILIPKGSTYVASHGKDFLLANDAWARFIAIKYGPDGNAFLIDWYDKQACHWKQPEIWDRTNGRIYKISYRGTKPVTNLDLSKCSDAELVKYQSHENEWYAAHARRIMMERSQDRRMTSANLKTLADLAFNGPTAHSRLRGMWALNASQEMKPENFQKTIDKSIDTEVVKFWFSRLMYENDPKTVAEVLTTRKWAVKDPLMVRDIATLAIIGEPALASSIVWELTLDEENRNDPMLRCLVWYAYERNAVPAMEYLIKPETEMPAELRKLIYRRLASDGDAVRLARILEVLKASQYSRQRDHLGSALQGFADGLPSSLPKPASEAVLAQLPALRYLDGWNTARPALQIGAMLHDEDSLETLRDLALNASKPIELRAFALETLAASKDRGLAPHYAALLKEAALRGPLFRMIAAANSLETPKFLLDHYAKLDLNLKRNVIAILASKPAYAMELLNAIEAKTIPTTDVPAETIRQLRSFKDDKLNAKVVAVWGTLRDTPAERKKFIAEWRSKLALSHDPDLSRGRAVFAKTCQQCHTLYGVGANVGPDITGSNRSDLNYLLENIFDPSAVIQKDYTATTFDMLDGRKITGIVKSENANQITVVTATETVKLNVNDIEKRKPSDMSMMPDDLTKPLTEREVKDLIAYLRHPNQVPMKATAENVKEFFNGKDLTGWDGDKELWKAENGEIVAKSETGLKKNQFLTNQLEVSDFKLSLKVKLTPSKENSGIQFRSVRIEGTEMRGPQADIGQGWWGKLYEESGRGLLVKEGGEKFVKVEDWNDYVIEARGANVKVWINGNLVFDYTDEKMSKKGLIGLQAHSGGPLEVRFKDLKLEILE